MENYFRITAYNKQEDISIIVDSNGKFDKIWQFSSHLLQKGFSIVEVSKPDNFIDGNLPRVAKESSKILLRASSKGKPMQTTLTIDGTKYQAIQVADKKYVPSIS